MECLGNGSLNIHFFNLFISENSVKFCGKISLILSIVSRLDLFVALAEC